MNGISKPKISVIVPVYNVEKYLSRCIDSILNQTFTNFELILVDDGSPDSCGVICEEYAKQDNRVKVIHKENGGLSSARNVGIDNALGDYLTFIDSDDWVETNYLEVLYMNLIDNDADISAVNYHKEYDDYRLPCLNVVSGLLSGEECLKYLYDSNMSIYVNIACAKLYKKNLFENIRYPSGKTHEDGFTTYKLYTRATRVYFANNDLYAYYQRNGSIMNRNFSLKRIDEYFVYLERKNFFLQNQFQELFIDNEKTRLTCIKSLTVSVIKSDINRDEKRKYLNLFKRDIIRSFKNMTLGENIKRKVSCVLYMLSPTVFYAFSRFI